jgi:autotransporter-associated beta strand protein
MTTVTNITGASVAIAAAEGIAGPGTSGTPVTIHQSGTAIGLASHLVVVDPSVEDWRTLVADLGPDAGLLVLDPARDGVQAIAAAVAARRGLAALHIVAHGRPGEVRLGSAILSSASLDRHTDALTRIGRSLKIGGDILLYGCDVARGEAGRSFVERFAQLTGADVAAATHPVGAGARGGSFDLDVCIGAVAAATPFAPRSLAAFGGLLDGGSGGAGFGLSAGGGGGAGYTGQPGGNGADGVGGGGGGGGGSGTTTGGAGGTGGSPGEGYPGGSGGSGGVGAGGAGGNGTDGEGSAGSTGAGGGGGGGGGVAGNGNTGTLSSNSTGGAGGGGGNGGPGREIGGGGGGGGAGGDGAVVTSSVDNTFTVTGGNGGGGGSGGPGSGNVLGEPQDGYPAAGGDGGVGLQVDGSGFTVTNSGSITGGNGGAGVGPGAGGDGLAGAGVTVVNSGAISAGLGAGGTTPGNAIEFTGGANTLTLSGSWSLTGGIVLDTSSTSVTFDQSNAQTVANAISGSGSVIQDGTGTLTLSGVNTYSGGTSLNAGTLAVDNDSEPLVKFVPSSALGTGGLAMADGTTLQIAGTESFVDFVNAITLSGTDTFDTNGLDVDTDFQGIISGTGKLIKDGVGTLWLDATNTYSGGTIVKAGSLGVFGSIADSAVEVEEGALFGGNGAAGAVTVDAGGTFAPGGSYTLAVASLSVASGANFDEEIEGANPGTGFPGGYDQTIVQNNGTISLGGATLNLSLIDGFAPTVGDTFAIIDNETGSAVSGTFAGLAQGAVLTSGGTLFAINYAGGSNNRDVVLTCVAQPTISGRSTTADYYEGQASPATIDSGIAVSDPNGADITGATVSLGASFKSGDVLNFTERSGIREQSYANGVLTLSGDADRHLDQRRGHRRFRLDDHRRQHHRSGRSVCNGDDRWRAVRRYAQYPGRRFANLHRRQRDLLQ